ncbi:MAG: hypothetical protein J7L42_03430 [Elusimicrobia bacterium]|nr:hypothetical protein [Elusimicrobiota bacterium]
MKKGIKAVLLLSGGLDSILAGKILQNQGIDVYAFHATTPFFSCNSAIEIAKSLSIPIKLFSLKDEYLEIVKHPKHGWGKGINPCIDCRILLFKKAKEFMEEIGAKFLITGEVLGQRPMSQNLKALKTIEEEAGVCGLVLRPLSAKFFPPTLAEKQAWVEREKLLDIKGRTRKRQFELAKKYNIQSYACPAGGCLLTDPVLSKRFKDAILHNEFTMQNIPLLKTGRHFRIEGEHFIVGRNEGECVFLKKYKGKYTLFEARDFPSATGLLLKNPPPELWQGIIKTASSIILRYGKAKQGKGVVRAFLPNGSVIEIEANAISQEILQCLKIS